MGDYEKRIRKLVRALEGEAAASVELREWAKTDGGRLSEFGKSVVAAAKDCKLPQSVVARVLDVDPSVVSRRYAALDS